MTQSSMSVANDTGANVRTGFNGALQALASNNSGTAAPTTTYAYQLWADTTNGLLKLRNSSNTAWITIGTLDTANLALVPVGSMLWWPDTTPPTGFLARDGSLISRTTYADLWAMANASANITDETTWAASQWGSFSTGDLSTTFRLMDDRGEFMRGYDGGRGIDSGRVMGVWQDIMQPDHSHTNYGTSAQGGYNSPYGAGLNNLTAAPTGTMYGFGINTSGTNQSGTLTAAQVGSELRPRNNAYLPIIKY